MKAKFMAFNFGANLVRVVTQPWMYLSHENYRSSIGSSDSDQRLKCPYANSSPNQCTLCQDGEKAVPRYILGAIDWQLSDISLQLIDLNERLYKQVQALANDEHWGNPQKYDLDFHWEDRKCFDSLHRSH